MFLFRKTGLDRFKTPSQTEASLEVKHTAAFALRVYKVN